MRYLLLAVAVCCGVACIVVGLEWVNPPERGNEEMAMYYAVGEGWGKVLGWALIVFGGLIFCTAGLGAFLVLRRARHTKLTAREVDRSRGDV